MIKLLEFVSVFLFAMWATLITYLAIQGRSEACVALLVGIVAGATASLLDTGKDIERRRIIRGEE